MAKWIISGIVLVGLALGTAAYVVTTGTPAVPSGVCPALLSVAPYNANVILYADFTTLRSAEFSRNFDAFQKSPQAGPFRDFLEKTNFHPDRDLDHVLLTATADSNAGALVLEGRFDSARIIDFVAPLTTMKHYESGDIYDFHNGSMQGSISMMFLGPNRVAIAAGMGAETQLLMLADAAKGSDPGLTADLCARAQRVSGAPFFALGDIPKVASAQLTTLVARENPSAADVMRTLQGWDAAYWMDGDTVRMALEAQFDSRYDALQAYTNLGKVRDSIQKSETSAKSGPLAVGPTGPVLDALSKNLAFSLDGHYIRMGTAAKKSDLQNFVTAASAPGRH